MKVYILREFIKNEDCDGEPYLYIAGVYANKQLATAKMNKLINDNVDNYDFVIDEEDNHRLFYGTQENWDNYIEYDIIEEEVKGE